MWQTTARDEQRVYVTYTSLSIKEGCAAFHANWPRTANHYPESIWLRAKQDYRHAFVWWLDLSEDTSDTKKKTVNLPSSVGLLRSQVEPGKDARSMSPLSTR